MSAHFSVGGYMAYEIVWEQKGVFIRYNDHLTPDVVVEASQTYQAHELYDSLHYIVIDTLNCSGVTCSDNDVLELAAIDGIASRTNKKARVAVAVKHSSILDVARKYISFGLNNHEVQLFSSVEDARQWATIAR